MFRFRGTVKVKTKAYGTYERAVQLLGCTSNNPRGYTKESMMKNCGGIMFVVLFVLALLSFAYAEAITTREDDVRSGPGTEGNQQGTLKAGGLLRRIYFFFLIFSSTSFAPLA